ncbi:MAG: hypothetical protein HRT89_02195 [Lentisphaeria bacterium]|nr:hypothetical protein [Lentisphaeria bacterium]NQZ66858.1 hypothetical protein [Lentisphaeria bacterium]
MYKRDYPENWNDWFDYFETNKDCLLDITFADDDIISLQTKLCIGQSVAIFQLGESSEGRTFINKAREFVARNGNQAYMKCLDLFIKEEHRHADNLKTFMNQQKIPVLRKQWTDSCFRFLRKCLDLEIEIRVLICAELIAKVYYHSLYDASHSPALKTICRQIMHDEDYHVQFQGQALALAKSAKDPMRQSLAHFFHYRVYNAAIAVVWMDHRSVLKSSGLSIFGFHKLCMREWQALQSDLKEHAKLFKKTTRWNQVTIRAEV